MHEFNCGIECLGSTTKKVGLKKRPSKIQISTISSNHDEKIGLPVN